MAEEEEESLVVSQMATEGENSDTVGGPGRNVAALIVSATTGAIALVIVLAIGMHSVARRMRMRRGATETTTETKSDVVVGNARAYAAMESGTEKKRDGPSSSSNDDDDEEGYFGSIRVRQWNAPDPADLSTLGADETVGYEVENYDIATGGRRCARSSSRSSLRSSSRFMDSTVSHCLLRIPRAFPPLPSTASHLRHGMAP